MACWESTAHGAITLAHNLHDVARLCIYWNTEGGGYEHGWE